eukprot:TRINITY_DN5577_c1_g1_i2.p1 TRINITY_DN5577_c1_g1~~TRINITY_DN5577_c1_g1_i2.p1  ORF type:complete len:424 (+),score=112.90 TRINITY_DN5577_c1_g1_i2:63-1334(+)
MAPLQVAAFASLIAGANGAAFARNPGAGMTPDTITPFKDYHKDGYSAVSCVLDSMLLHGDKHGDGKYDYKLGDVSNVSIVHYTEMVPKEDRKQMTHEVCYSFCRTVPLMGFFGITNGRDCYCTPFFKQMAGDSSDCDAVCDGDQTTMCGGKTKSSIFEMHSCNDAAAKVAEAKAVAEASEAGLSKLVGTVETAAKDMQASAVALQKTFGKVGDDAATSHMQDAKKFAGELEHAAADGAKAQKSLAALPRAAGANVVLTEKIIADLLAASKKANASADELVALAEQAVAPAGKDAGKLYYPVMYFADKNFTDVPTTCGGTLAEKPLVGTFEDCASACERAGALYCKGFSYFASSPRGLCFLLSDVSSAFYYTGCAKKAFLQRAASDTKCVLKFSAFEGTSIKPDGSGKCKACLKELTKADRCFE